MKKNTGIKTIQIIIVSLAILNLIALFVFDYKLPFMVNDTNDEPDILDVTEVPGYSIEFDSDEISYDGTGELDLMTGVKVMGPEGEIENAEVFANIITADSLSEKQITYSLDTAGGQVTATRKLILSNYTGPTLVLPENMPEADEKDLDTYLSLMPTDGSFAAKDGFGKDITAQVSTSYRIDSENPSIVHFVFSVTNLFNDKVSVPYDISIDSDRPTLVLSSYSVSISKGSAFQPLDYVQKAESKSGQDLLQTIAIEGSVDVNTPGKYTLSYTINDNGISSVPQKLEIVVE